MNKKPKSIFILGRRWRDKVNGNTYHTSQIVVDGKTVHETPMQYGYGNQYERTAADWLKAQGILPNEDKSFWTLCQDAGIIYESTVVDLPRRKDL